MTHSPGLSLSRVRREQETDTAGSIVNDQRPYAYGRRLDVGGDISGEKDSTGQ